MKMIKFRLYYDKDAETEWLNQMSAEGWAMKRFFAGFYRFEACEKGEYLYQVDFGEKFFSISDDYREFMQDTGAEIIQSWGYWILLRKPASEGKFELYTDVDSSIEHYRKIRRMFKIATILELICLIIELFAGVSGNHIGYAFSCKIVVILLAMVNAVYKTNRIIAGLQERRGETAHAKENRHVSPVLISGLLLNSCALAIGESVSSSVKYTVQIIAIVFMLTGVYFTGKSFRN